MQVQKIKQENNIMYYKVQCYGNVSIQKILNEINQVEKQKQEKSFKFDFLKGEYYLFVVEY